MNRVALAAPLALLVLSSSAAAQLAVRAAHGPAPTPAVAARLAALDPTGARLTISDVAADGTLRRLAGPLQLAGATLDERAADFVARYAPLFGADATMEFGAARPLQPRADGSPRALRLPQTVHGWEVDGAGLVLTLDEQGQALGASGFLSAAAAQLPAPTVSATQARDAALARLGLDLTALTGEPIVHGAVRIGAAGPALVQRVGLVVRAGLRPLKVDVDATTGAVLSVRDDRSDAVGNITLNGINIQFPLGTGSGNAYPTVSAAVIGAETGVSLPALTVAAIDSDLLLLPDTLTGRYCTVSDLVAVIQAPFMSFPFHDMGTASIDPPSLEIEGEAFDQVDTYYWITRTAQAYTKIVGTLPSDTCVPIIVNYDFDNEQPPQEKGLLNAFFSPDALAGFSPGFMVFGDSDVVTGDLMDDFSRDPTIVSHEYFHCMSAFAGLSFGDDAIDTPPRAVNEAIADYGAATFLNTPLIGKALVTHEGPDFPGVFPPGELRDLSSEITLTDDLFDTVDAQNGNLPEEHEAGKIFGCALWRLRTTAKSKVANNVIVNSLAAWPQSSAAVGFPTVTAANAQDAYEAFDFEAFIAVANKALTAPGAKAWKNVSNVLGAFLSHGITGSTVNNVVELPTATGKETLNFKAKFLGTETDHVFELDLAAGQQVSITLTGDKTDATQIDFAFVDGPAALSFPNDKVVNALGTKVTQKGIVVNTTGAYVLDLFTNSGSGAYKALIKIK